MSYVMKTQNYLVIIGDVVKSREIKDRQQFQEIFKDQFEKIGVFEKNNIVSSFTITIGDEFQGVLSKAAKMFKFIADLEYSLNLIPAKEDTDAALQKTKYLYKLRYGIGVGTITTKINRAAALGMDGPAFYNARKSIEYARKNNLRFYFAGGSDKDASINTLLQWLNLEIKEWNFRKFQIVKLYKDSWKQEQIAESLGISQPAVSKLLKNTPMELMIQTEDLIENEINSLLKQ
jgi:SatD family (SatD)